jgi:predicted nucleic acid-binding protein
VILVDTTPLVALCDPRDGLHARAVKDLDKVGRRALIVCAPVLTETCFLLEHTVQRQRLAQLLLGVGAQPFVFHDEALLWSRVFTWLEKYEEHDPDWADGYLAVASAIARRAVVWTYDKDFRTTWRREDGSKIPLAFK